MELFRQPDVPFRGLDDPLGTVLGPLTMGQTLSALVILGGAASACSSGPRAAEGGMYMNRSVRKRSNAGIPFAC